MSKQYHIKLVSEEDGTLIDDKLFFSEPTLFGFIVAIAPYIAKDTLTITQEGGNTLTKANINSIVNHHTLGVYNDMSVGSEDDFDEAVEKVKVDLKNKYFILEYYDGVITGIGFDDPAFYEGYEIGTGSMGREDVIKNSRIYDSAGSHVIKE